MYTFNTPRLPGQIFVRENFIRKNILRERDIEMILSGKSRVNGLNLSRKFARENGGFGMGEKMWVFVHLIRKVVNPKSPGK